MKRITIRPFANTLTIRAGILISATIILFLVIISPIALQQLAHVHGIDWLRLSNIGQTYGAVSALLTALALGGVVASLIYQARDVSTARQQANRTFHNELLKMEMDNPLYMDVIGAPFGQKVGLTDYNSLRQNHFVHMWVLYWEGQYKLREMSDDELRYFAANELFASAAGRRYWSIGRSDRLRYYKGRLRRCTLIIDEEYSKAIAIGPPAATSLDNNPSKTTSSVFQQISPAKSGVLICVAAGTIFLASRLLGRRFYSRSH